MQKRASKISKVGKEEKNMLDDMAATMYLSNGIGLAAVQVGINKQLAVIDVGTGLIKMVNPEIVKCEGTQAEEEGCLSVPGVSIRVKRAKKVTVRFLKTKTAKRSRCMVKGSLHALCSTRSITCAAFSSWIILIR